MSSKINEKEQNISVQIPLTISKSKIRIKKRNFLNEYGYPSAARQEAFSQKHYVEWQIGYDVYTEDREKLLETSLKDKVFTGYNGKKKALYELSEYIYYFRVWDIIRKQDLESIRDFLLSIDKNLFLDVNPNYSIERTHPVEKNLFGIDFELTQVKYPLLIHKFKTFEIITEIKITERQYAVGIQPMLYLCFPITELYSQTPLLNRTAAIREKADFIINKGNFCIFMEMLKIFGILSKSHNYDVLAIIDLIEKS
jgi:hypothetical protein